MSLAQQIIYTAEQVERLKSEAFQAGYNLALRAQESLRHKQERQLIQYWQGICESREGDECGHDD